MYSMKMMDGKRLLRAEQRWEGDGGGEGMARGEAISVMTPSTLTCSVRKHRIDIH